MPELLFYEKVAVLDRDKHRKHRIKPLGHHGFAARAHAVPLLAAEYVQAGREYPIVFARAPDGQVHSFALTGAQDEQNLFLDAAGRWDARYIPAFVRRYPFVFAQTGRDELTVCVDESYSGFNRKEGDSLFGADGAPTPFMQGVLDLLSDYQRQAALTETFVKALEHHGLLTEVDLDAATPDGRRARITGALVVDEQKFRGLPAAQLQAWSAGGELALIYAHLFSLGNVIELARRMPAPQPQPESKLSKRTGGRASRPNAQARLIP